MWLTVNAGVEEGTSVEVTRDRFVLGRADSCDFVVDDEKVSREHAAFETGSDGQAVIKDLGSSNGTFVNGRRITEPVPLTGDEHIRVGDTAFVLSPTEPSKAPETVVAPSPSIARAGSAPARIDEPEPAPRIGRSTVQRIVSDALRDEDKKLRRSTKIATGVGLLGVIAAAAVGALFATGTIASGSSGSTGPSITALERATVLISVLDSSGNVTEIGSGTIIRPDGYILTNSHVAEPDAPGLPVEYGIGAGGAKPASIEISLFDGEARPAKAEYLAKTLAYDGYVDVAVVKIVSTLNGRSVANLHLPAVPIGNSDKLRDGEPVTVVGFPAVGGGFQGSINVSRGAVSGFQHDIHIPGPRGWIKTDAAIDHGNSGGLAANQQGQLVGIPSRIQCGNNLFQPCMPGDDRQGKIRPINLALPIIHAAEQGRTWSTRSVVVGTGNEKFTFVAWTASQPDNSCHYTPVKNYPSGTTSITAVYTASGMTANEDFALLRTYAATQTSTATSTEELHNWLTSYGSSASCFWFNLPLGQGDGSYSFQVFAGALLHQASDRDFVSVGR